MHCRFSILIAITVFVASQVAGQKVGINTNSPVVELDIRTLSPADGSDLILGNSDQTHFLRLFSGRDGYPSPIIYWKDGDPMLFGTNLNIFTERMRITSPGLVGVGTANPLNRLDVKSDGAVDSGATIVLGLISDISNRPTLQFSEWETALPNSGMAIEYDGTTINRIRFLGTDTQPKVTITTGGRLGIMTDEPNEFIEVAGTGALAGRIFIGDGNGVNRKGLLIDAVEPGNYVRLHPYDYSTATAMDLYLPGNVTIGLPVGATGYRLSVDGKVMAEELRIQLSGSWPDYVFDEKYDLPDLLELEKTILRDKHLPGIPTAGDISRDGLMVGDMQTRMMEKIEELTLYIIRQEKELVLLKAEIEALKNK